MFKEKVNKMTSKEGWKDIGIREKMQIVNGTALIASAIILYFVSFIITMTIGFEIISAGGTLLATGLAFFGITSFVKNQLVSFETKLDREIRKREKEKTENEEIDDEG